MRAWIKILILIRLLDPIFVPETPPRGNNLLVEYEMK